MITNVSLFPAGAKTADATSRSGSGAVGMSKQFGQFLNDAIQGLNDQQAQVNDLTQQLATGDLNDVSQVMLASQKASLGLELTVQVRNKVIDAYQEIMRMQV